MACDAADSFLQVAGIYEQYERDLEAVIDLVGEENREEVIRRTGLYDSPLSPLSPDFESRVIVVSVDWHASIAPWSRGASDSVEFKAGPLNRFISESVFSYEGALRNSLPAGQQTDSQCAEYQGCSAVQSGFHAQIAIYDCS